MPLNIGHSEGSGVKRLMVFGALIMIFGVVGCAAKQLDVRGSQVQVVYEKPEGNCRKIGDVVGSQGNWLTGGYTSNKNLAQGALNDMRNQAGQMNGSHVWIHQQEMNTTGLSTTNSIVMGTVYKCE